MLDEEALSPVKCKDSLVPNVSKDIGLLTAIVVDLYIVTSHLLDDVEMDADYRASETLVQVHQAFDDFVVETPLVVKRSG